MSTVEVDIYASIVPGLGLGGLSIGMRLSDVDNLLRPELADVEGVDAVYLLENGALGATVDIRNENLYLLGAHKGYKGLLLEKIHIGMFVREAAQFIDGLYYDEVEEAVLFHSLGGVALLTEEDDPSPEEVFDLRIASILVFKGPLNNARHLGGIDLESRDQDCA
jgi:hypothetical protein